MSTSPRFSARGSLLVLLGLAPFSARMRWGVFSKGEVFRPAEVPSSNAYRPSWCAHKAVSTPKWRR